MRPLALTLYAWASGALSPLAPKILQSRARRGKEDPSRVGERLGRPSLPRPARRLIWLHAASVGEGLSLLPLIEGLSALRPEAALLVTTGTVSAADLMRSRLPESVAHQYAPIDTCAATNRFTAHWKPDLAIFVESEIWPNLIQSARTAGAKLALVSARFSPESLERWAWAPATARRLLSAFDLMMAQDDLTAAGLQRLGGRDDGRLNLKRWGKRLPVDADKVELLKAKMSGRPVVLAASTHAGEDPIVLQAFRRSGADAQLVIAPRHPQRADAVQAAVQDAGYTVGVQSRGDAFGHAPVFIADTLGDLGLWYSLAAVAFIGGSLVKGPGGHNPLEAAQLSCPIIVGSYLENWTAIYQELSEADALLVVKDVEGLAEAVAGSLSKPKAAAERAKRAHAMTTAHADGLAEGLARLSDLLS